MTKEAKTKLQNKELDKLNNSGSSLIYRKNLEKEVVKEALKSTELKQQTMDYIFNSEITENPLEEIRKSIK